MGSSLVPAQGHHHHQSHGGNSGHGIRLPPGERIAMQLLGEPDHMDSPSTAAGRLCPT
jgi:hypothetical protein